MGTRGVIAKPHGDGFAGRYHHWDSYPTGLGRTLWQAYHGYFAGDLDAMTTYLIDNEKAGWSTINEADLSLGPQWQDAPRERKGPQSFSARGEDQEMWIRSDGDDGGTEWAYVLSPAGLWIFERTYGDDGTHATGWFGLATGGNRWAPRGLFPWEGAEPEWEAVEGGDEDDDEDDDDLGVEVV